MFPFPAALLCMGAATTAPYGTHSYWRILFSTNWGDSSWTGLSEIEMRSTAGGADQCSGGTPSISNSSGGGSAANLYDGNTATSWVASGATGQWAAYHFASPVEILEVALTASSGINSWQRIPKDCIVQYSDDGSTWTDAFSFTWDSPVYGSTRTFPQAAFASGYARSWRISITANNGDGSFTYVDEAEFRATAGGADQTSAVGSGNGTTAGRVFGTMASAYKAFDNVADSAGGSPKLSYFAFAFPDPVKVEEIVLTNTSSLTRSPKDFTFDWLDQDGATWHTQKSWTGITWAAGESKTLTAI